MVYRRFGRTDLRVSAIGLGRPFVTSVLIAATTMGQLKTDIAAAGVALPAELEGRINAIHLIHQNPCP